MGISSPESQPHPAIDNYDRYLHEKGVGHKRKPAGGTHHCDVCKGPPKADCIRSGHMHLCSKCHGSWSSYKGTTCPYCLHREKREAARREEEERKAKEAEENEQVDKPSRSKKKTGKGGKKVGK